MTTISLSFCLEEKIIVTGPCLDKLASNKCLTHIHALHVEVSTAGLKPKSINLQTPHEIIQQLISLDYIQPFTLSLPLKYKIFQIQPRTCEGGVIFLSTF